MEKITNVKALSIVLNTCELSDEVRAKLEKMKSQFEKKNSAEKKPTATQIANEGIKNTILEVIGDSSLTITEETKRKAHCKRAQPKKSRGILKFPLTN